MKRVVFGLFLGTQVGMAQLSDDDIKLEVAGIDKEVKRIENQVKSLKKTDKTYVTAGGSGTLTVYRDKTGDRKLILAFDGDGASNIETYFFQHDNLIFTTTKWTSFPQWEEQVETTTEARYYFMISGALIRWETREYSDKETPFQAGEAPDWNAVQENTLARASRLKRFLQSPLEDLDAFE